MAHRATKALAAVLLTALVGCTGLDHVATTPPSGDPLPATDAVITVRFDRPLDPRRVATASVVLTQGEERIPVRAELAGTGDGLVVHPLAPLRPGVSAVLTVESGVRGLGRRASKEPVTASWLVAAPPRGPMTSKSFQLKGSVAPR